MNKVDVAKLLTRASAVDNRVVTEETVEAWYEILCDVYYPAAVDAINEHFKTSTEYLLPGHIVAGAKRSLERLEREKKREEMLDPASERNLSLEQSSELRRQPIPTCEHGVTIVRCDPCCKRLAEEENI
jgi:hypothetical protein